VKVVLDASVIVAAVATKNPRSASRVVIEAAARGACELVVTDEIEAEYLEAIARPKVKRASPAGFDGHAFVAAVVAVAERVEPVPDVQVIEGDPDDDKYVAAALAGHADVVLTFDRKHMLVLRAHQGIRFLTPGDFLAALAKTLG
jgi:putative PIN family toxin of toxin-antitoxin system